MAEENKMTQDAEEVKEEVPAEEAPDTESVEETCEAASEETEEEAGEPAEEETETAEESQEETQKKSIFGKKKDKKDKKDTKIEELTDRLQRTMAEFDNFRKRTEKEKASMYVIGAKEIIEKMLPVVDNFERGLASVPEEEKNNPYIDGIDKIYRHLMTTLEGIGVKPIEAVGTEFDPDFHNAVMHVEDEELGENVVAEELQKGYMYRDSVVRHSMVKVAN